MYVLCNYFLQRLFNYLTSKVSSASIVFHYDHLCKIYLLTNSWFSTKLTLTNMKLTRREMKSLFMSPCHLQEDNEASVLISCGIKGDNQSVDKVANFSP